MMNERKKVLIAYDGSAYADAALDDLRRAGLPREAEALIVTVSDGLVRTSSSVAEVAGIALTSRRVTSAIAVAKDQAARLLAEAMGFATEASRRVRSYFPGWEVRTEVLEGSPSRELLRKAERWQPDLVVVGSQGRSALGRFFLGSVSKKLATESRSAVRVVRRIVEKNDDEPPRIMIGVDGSPGAERAVRSVGRRVWPEGTEVRIVAVDDGVSPTRIAHILPSTAATIRSSNEKASEAARMMVEWAAEELRAIGLRVSVAIVEGDPQSILIEEALKWEADSIFVGSHGLEHPGEEAGLGSVSTGLVTKAHCSVEVVR
ncbi:MAG TPA: universal stress protein [Pyrinomonadaceae bacterium]|jgi:nucleotide-binding universal stress UspA family protein